VTAYEALAAYRTRTALRIALLVYLGLLLRLVSLPLAVAALLCARLVAVVDPAATPAPPSPPRWVAANTRTRTYATV
jgi:hypothetical protein